MGPDEIGTAVNSFVDMRVLGLIFKYIGYTLIAVLILGLMVVIYFWFQFKYKVYYPKLLYDTDGSSAQMIGLKKDRARIVKKKDGTKYTMLLFKRIKMEPIREEDIKPGNKIWVMRLNDDGTYKPFPPFILNKVFDHYEGEGEDKQEVYRKEPVKWEYLTNDIKQWAVVELKDTANTYQDTDAHKKMLVMVLVTGILCLITVVLAVWISMKYTGNVVAKLDGITPALSNIASSFGGSPN